MNNLKRKHGKSGTQVYRAWQSIKGRCNNPNNSGYENYGGRGIKVCQRWMDSFENFYADMGDPPTGLSIDRINNDGDYEPGNCRWATPKEQTANSRKRKTSGSLVWRKENTVKKSTPRKKMTPKTPLALRFQQERLKLFSTQNEAAEVLGVTTAAVCHWERGIRPVPEIIWLFLNCLKKKRQITP